MPFSGRVRLSMHVPVAGRRGCAAGLLHCTQRVLAEDTGMDKSQNLIWIDLEMTGLKPDTDRIISHLKLKNSIAIHTQTQFHV